MRPAGEVRRSLLQACTALAAPGQGVTLREMAHQAQVGLDAARSTVSDLRRAGHLRIDGQRRVAYRNRPVAEYVPVCPVREQDDNDGDNNNTTGKGCMGLALVLRVWAC